MFGFKITLPLRAVENDIFNVRGLRDTIPIRRAIDDPFMSGCRCVMAIGAALTSAVTAVVSIQRERGRTQALTLGKNSSRTIFPSFTV